MFKLQSSISACVNDEKESDYTEVNTIVTFSTSRPSH